MKRGGNERERERDRYGKNPTKISDLNMGAYAKANLFTKTLFNFMRVIL